MKRVIVGISGTEMTNEERENLSTYQPLGVILFARNINNYEQVKKLIADIKETLNHNHVLIAVDQNNLLKSFSRYFIDNDDNDEVFFVNYSAAMIFDVMSDSRACGLFDDYIETQSKFTAQFMSDLGINMSFLSVDKGLNHSRLLSIVNAMKNSNINIVYPTNNRVFKLQIKDDFNHVTLDKFGAGFLEDDLKKLENSKIFWTTIDVDECLYCEDLIFEKSSKISMTSDIDTIDSNCSTSEIVEKLVNVGFDVILYGSEHAAQDVSFLKLKTETDVSLLEVDDSLLEKICAASEKVRTIDELDSASFSVVKVDSVQNRDKENPDTLLKEYISITTGLDDQKYVEAIF